MLALKNLLRNKLRTMLNITGITVAVLSFIIFTSLGSGLVDTGEKVFEASSMHLWISGKPLENQNQYIQSSPIKIDNAHSLNDQILTDPRINMATPILTEIIYAYKEDSNPKAVFGMGVWTGGSETGMVKTSQGGRISGSTIYSSGTYSGNLTNEVMVDSRAAHLLDVGPGDTIFAGKTQAGTGKREFTVVGISDSLSSFSVNPTIIFPFAEFQYITGNHYHDSASLIIVRLHDVSDAQQVKQDLQQHYPEYRISTNRDFLDTIIKQNSFLIASAASIVLLAVLMGTSLVLVTVLLSVQERKHEIGVLQTIGLSRWSIARMFGLEGFLISVAGGVLGLVLSVPAAGAVNYIGRSATGLDLLLVLDGQVLGLGFLLALVIGSLSTLAAVWRLAAVDPMEHIRSV